MRRTCDSLAGANTLPIPPFSFLMVSCFYQLWSAELRASIRGELQSLRADRKGKDASPN